MRKAAAACRANEIKILHCKTGSQRTEGISKFLFHRDGCPFKKSGDFFDERGGCTDGYNRYMLS